MKNKKNSSVSESTRILRSGSTSFPSSLSLANIKTIIGNMREVISTMKKEVKNLSYVITSLQNAIAVLEGNDWTVQCKVKKLEEDLTMTM